MKLLLLLIGLACVASATGQVLRDPTRPPDVMAVDGAGEVGRFRLDMVLRPVSGRPTAIINGQSLKPGDEIDGVKLIEIRDASVVLRGADGKETVTLAPGVEKTMRTTKSDGARGKRPRGGGHE